MFEYEGHNTLAPGALLDRQRGRPGAFVLDRAGRTSWSFAGASPVRRLVVERSGRARHWNGRRWKWIDDDPIETIAAFVRREHAEPLSRPDSLDNETVVPRTVGYLAYELGRFIENVPSAGPSLVGTPLAVLSTYAQVDAWHPLIGRIERLVFERAGRRQPPPPEPFPAPANPPTGDGGYRRAFARIQRAISAGEIYQANLARVMVLPLNGDALDAYLRLRNRQPVPWGAYLEVAPWHLLSNSPECFLSISGSTVRTFPIKGTRPRGASLEADEALRRELANDEKENAEHLMIVDLERNDLGRVCEIGSVTVPVLGEVQTFSTLHHLVSEVRGTLRRDVGLVDVLRATFPGGSITGAPKIRAMEIIAEVEPHERGVYTGAIGCFNGERSVELNIAIRTAVAAGNRIVYFAGGGIVADSVAAAEYRETETKALAFIESLSQEHAAIVGCSPARSSLGQDANRT